MKRAAFVLLVVAGVLTSSLALVAQDRRAGAAKLYEVHMYNVRDLVFEVRDYPAGVNMNLVPSGGFGFFADVEESELLARYEGDLLVDLIRENVAPISWRELRSVDIAYRNGVVIVRHTGEVHKKVADLLDMLRARVASQIKVSARWVRVTDGVLRRVIGNGSRFSLDAEAEKRLAAAIEAGEVTVVAEGSVLCTNTQRVAITEVTQVSYLQDYDVEIAQEAQIADPIVWVAHEGVIADVRPTIAGGGGALVMEIRADAGKMRRPIETSVTDVGEIEVPALDLQQIRTTVAMPAGRTTVVGGTLSEPGGDGLLLLVRGTLVK